MTRTSASVDPSSVLLRTECDELLRADHIGRVVTTIGAEHRPLIRPVSYVYDDRTASVVFVSMPGAKLHSLLECRDACFEIDGERDGALWSVIVRGRVETEERPAEIARLEGLGIVPALVMPPGERWVRIHAEAVSGRSFSPATA